MLKLTEMTSEGSFADAEAPPFEKKKDTLIVND